ncbi:MAG: helix-hairpin-helix domain-containing protein [Bacteroidales bacterium]|nr:helix-hairpin-helix domain-containing protein [Bacteroidales bacterium]
MEEGKRQKTLKHSFTTGAVALIFLIIGYQVALFLHKAAVSRVVADRDRPDTVFVVDRTLAEEVLRGTAPDSVSGRVVVRRSSSHAPEAVRLREKAAGRRVETFRFNPNTVSAGDLVRLGFSEKQAQSILNYRAHGGRFHRPSDFAKSYVVADSVFERLEPYIDIPRIDINRADSTAFETLPGIGPYFASKMVSYRSALGGYSYPEQLMDIYHFDQERFDGLKDLISCSRPAPYPIWTLPEADLARHPYLSRAEAHSIVLYRTHQPVTEWNLEGIRRAGILSEDHLRRLSRCILAGPDSTD